MKTRRIATLAVAAAVALGTTGCTFLAPVATENVYNPSDGVAATTGPLELRNAFIISDDGEVGNLAMAVVNATDDASSLVVEYGEGAARQSASILIPANTNVSFGSQSDEIGADPILVPGIDTMPGAMLEVYFAADGEPGALVDVPVLTSELEQYSHLAPTSLQLLQLED